MAHRCGSMIPRRFAAANHAAFPTMKSLDESNR